MKQAIRFVVIAFAISLSACSPTPTELKPIVGANTITYKGLTFTKPSDRLSFLKIRDQEVFKAVKDRKLSAPEAQSLLRSEKRRLGLPDPNRTPGFDAMLRKAGLLK